MTRWRTVVAVAALLLWALTGALVLKPAAALLLAAPLLFWLPGALVVSRTAGLTSLSPAARLAAELVVSFGFVALLVEVLGWLGSTADAAPVLVALSSLLMLASAKEVAETNRDWSRADLIVVSLAVGAAMLSWARGSTVGPMDDAGTHLTLLARAGETGMPQRTSPFFAEDVPWQYADAWPRILHAPSRWAQPSSGDLLELWHLSGAIVALVIVMAAYLAASACLAPPFALVAAAAHTVAVANDSWSIPSALGVALLWGTIGLALHGERSRRASVAATVAVVAAGMAALHPVEAVLACYGLASTGVVRVVLRRSWDAGRWLFRLAVTVVAASLPIVVIGNRFIAEQAASGELIDPSFELIELIAGVWVVDPRFWGLEARSPLLWLALAALFLVATRGHEPLRSLTAGLVVAVGLGLLCPPVAWVVLELNLPSFLLARTGLLFPQALLVGALVALTAGRARTVALAVCLSAVTWVAVGQLSESSPRRRAARHPILTVDSRALLASIPHGSVILTDLHSADFMPLVGGHDVVAGITWHTASTRDQLTVFELMAGPSPGDAAAIDLLRRRRVDYVLVTDWRGSDLDWPGYGSQFVSPRLAAALAENPLLYERVGATDRLSLWRTLRPLPQRPPGPALATDSAAGLGGGLMMVDDWAVVAAQLSDEGVVVRLRATTATRSAPLLAAIATPAEFVETSATQRVVRVLRGDSLGHATARLGPWVRIDHRFRLTHEHGPGTAVSIVIPLRRRSGDQVWVGDARALPSFPRPLGPVLDRDFYRVAVVVDAPGRPSTSAP